MRDYLIHATRSAMPIRDLLENRDIVPRSLTGVLSIVYQGAAADITLADPANLERLHRLCARRLRIVERMLYDVSRHTGRGWDAEPDASATLVPVVRPKVV